MKWEELPDYLKNTEVEIYFNELKKKKIQFILKRIFDIFFSFLLIIILSPILIVLSIMIKLDSDGPVLFKQERVTRYGKKFNILKFRTMVDNADTLGSLVTVKQDDRITKMGLKIRKSRLDELPQLFNVLIGDMSFVGTRPEVPKYVSQYQNEMYATLLTRAGVTSLASIMYKDESEQLSKSENIDYTYVYEILPKKMKYNLEEIKKFSLSQDIKILFKTVLAVLR